MNKQRVLSLLVLLIGAMSLLGCNSEPQVVEVTRVVSEEVPVTVEVAQVATVEVPLEVTVQVEVEVEVTRVVEVVVTPTMEPTATGTAVPESTPTPTAEPTSANNIYVIKPGDSIALISSITGVDPDVIRETNNIIVGKTVLFTGQELIIPGWDGEVPVWAVGLDPLAPKDPKSQPTSETGTVPEAVAANDSPNLLPNGSFEGDWYFFNGVNELQVPVGWFTYTDEGLNTLTDDPNDLFARPEIRLLTSAHLPVNEQSLFVFDGIKTIKAFKGSAPTSFAIFTDVALPAGSYRFSMSFFPDIVAGYQGGKKIWATDPAAAEVRVILNDGGTAWAITNIGTKNTVTYDFTLTRAATVRIGGAFRNRYPNSNNGWFLDDWKIYRLGQ